MDAVQIHRPRRASLLLYDSPHSGRYYPLDFAMGAPMGEMRRGEDAYVDELLLPSVEDGALLLTNAYPRCYIDVNRELTDLDPAQLSEPWPGELAPTDKSRRGLGLIRRFVVPGVEAQAGPLSVAAVERRIALVYKPYHAALDALVREMPHSSRGVLHIDWHSMKSVGNAMTPDGAGTRRPDFVVSDGDGTTADPTITSLIVDQLRAFGYRVSVNDPYKGGTIVKRIGAPARGIHSVQVEISRALYLDEISVTKSTGFVTLSTRLVEFTRKLVESRKRKQ